MSVLQDLIDWPCVRITHRPVKCLPERVYAANGFSCNKHKKPCLFGSTFSSGHHTIADDARSHIRRFNRVAISNWQAQPHCDGSLAGNALNDKVFLSKSWHKQLNARWYSAE